MAEMKYESSPQNHNFSMVEIDLPEIKCLKRRRRRPSATTLTKENLLDRPQQSQTLQVDQATATTATTATTTTTVKRSSRFRGVSRHRWTGRYEAHLWDKGSWNMTQRKKGKQVYLGAFDEEVSAARAYDLAAIKYWGTSTVTNFPISDYTNEIKTMQHVTKEEYLASLRRRSNGFARGASKYRGVARHHHNGRWEARIGRVFGNKYLYLGTYNTQEEAAHAYDIAAIEYKGLNAVTNFDMNTYIRWPKPGLDSHATQTISTEINPTERPALAYNSNSYTTGGFSFSHKQEVVETKLPLSPCSKPASPTALSLLHRSSMYKELKAKNPNAGNEERVGNTIYNNSQSGVEDFTFFNGNAAYLCSYDTDKLPELESPGYTTSLLHDQARQTVQFLLNDFNMPPSIH